MTLKVLLYFKDKHIGTLTYDKGIYKYNSNLEGEAEAIKKYFTLRFYDLGNHVDFSSDKVFPFFLAFLDRANKDENKKDARIYDTDTDFMKLFKYATVKQDTSGYYLKQGFDARR